MRLATTANLTWLVVYLATIAALVFILLETRQHTLASFDTDEQRGYWTHWKSEAQQVGQSQKNPVEHSEPDADEPPTLVLMRDHFAVVMSAGLLFGSLLFGVTMLLIRGIFSRSCSA
ncbi:MAG: hypothetical protein IID44_31120 [Planctomycetes bacterium]|nr:hypothetical protein [Planctomycetota bacterium]